MGNREDPCRTAHPAAAVTPATISGHATRDIRPSPVGHEPLLNTDSFQTSRLALRRSRTETFGGATLRQLPERPELVHLIGRASDP